MQASTKVFVGNINRFITEVDLERHFGQCGKVLDVTIPRNVETYEPLGWALVELEDEESAKRAVNQLNGAEVYGFSLRVSSYKPKRQE